MSDDLIPFVVLGGWLGSGKTTLLKQLLEATGTERIAVIVNDVGEVNIDAALIRARGHDTIELTNGCVCCSIGGSLALTMRDLVMADQPPDRIVIEASGVADPAKVALYGDRRRVRLDAVVVTIDVGDVAARAAHRTYGAMVRHQAAVADLLVLTKTDLVGEDRRREAEAWCSTVAPGVPTTKAPTSLGDVAALLGPTSRPVVKGPELESFRYLTRHLAGPVDLDRLVAALDDPGLLRAKGFVTGSDGARYEVHRAGRRVELGALHDDGPDLPDVITFVFAPGRRPSGDAGVGPDLEEVLGVEPVANAVAPASE